MPMPERSSIDSHRQKKKIIDLLLNGVPFRTIGESVSPPVSAMTLQRYKTRKLVPALQNAKQHAAILTVTNPGKAPILTENAICNDSKVVQATRDALDSDICVERAEEIWTHLVEPLRDGVRHDNLGSIAGQALKSIELLGKLTGRLDSGNVTKVQIVVAMPTAPQLAEVDNSRLIDVSPAAPRLTPIDSEGK